MKDCKYLLVLVFIVILTSCKQTNWYENYKEKRKSPFGTFIIQQEVKKLFPHNEVKTIKKNIYDYLMDDSIELYESLNHNYIIIKNNVSKIDDDGINELLNFVESGNVVFMALNQFPDLLNKELGFDTENLDAFTYLKSDLKKLKGEFEIDNHYGKQTYYLDRTVKRHYFKFINDTTTKVLGTAKINNETKPNFIKVNYGNGNFFLHTNPIAFTNYYLLKKSNKTYVEEVFSYLPDKDILWDPHIKSSSNRYAYDDNDSTDSIFNFFLQHKTLTWSLWLSFIGLLLFMLFNARRKQRPIPVISPLKNSTVEFAQTISYLYFTEGDHKNIIQKMTTYFLEQVRSKYLLNTSNLNSNFIEKLALKSGNSIESTNYLINTIIHFNKKDQCNETNVIVLHKMIKNFFKK